MGTKREAEAPWQQHHGGSRTRNEVGPLRGAAAQVRVAVNGANTVCSDGKCCAQISVSRQRATCRSYNEGRQPCAARHKNSLRHGLGGRHAARTAAEANHQHVIKSWGLLQPGYNTPRFC